MTNDFQFFMLIIVGIFVFLIFFSYFIPIRLWIAALSSGVSLGIISLIGMRLRRIPPTQIVLPKIKAIKAGINIETDILEAHFLAGGNVNKVIDSLIAAEKASINLNFERAAAIDLAGRDVLNAVKMSVLPKVISTPEIIAVAKDGIEVKAIARITVRTNINQLVGGAIEETVIARVGEGIVTTIGSANCHKDVLENPDSISKMVLGKGLDSGTAFEILSIDIADVNIGKNIGAHLQTDQAEADKKIAQARAEQRRAFAVSAEQEMKAKVIEMKAKVVEAEAQVPLAIAESFKSGNLGVMDYYRMRNMIADTDMRESISKSDEDLNKDQLD